MLKYRKKPVEVEAFKWTGGPDQTEDPEWIIEKIKSGDVWFYTEERGTFMQIRTLEGEMQASPGDYIIRGVKGEIYPCKPDIFELTYELADPTPVQPAIQPGDKVRHKDHKHFGIGNVEEIAKSGLRAYCNFPDYDRRRSSWEPRAYYRLDKLEVIK